MTQLPFAQLSQRSQIAILRPAVHHACRAFGITPTSIRCVNHGFNTTFRIIDSTHRHYALRANTHSLRTPAGITAEMAWIQALQDVDGIHVAKPCITPSGAVAVSIPFAPLNTALDITLAHWLPGRIVGGRPSRAQLRALGNLMARLHRHSAQWQSPTVADLPAINQLLMNSPDHLADAPPSIIPHDVRRLLAEVRPHIDAIYARLNTRMRTQVIHADLHAYNLMWHAGQLAVFDFDDAGVGLAIQDLAISTYYVRDIAGAEAEIRAGYAAVAPLPAISQSEFEGLLMGRGIVLLNDTLVLTTPADYAFLPEFVRRMQLRLQHYVDTETFALIK
jgi:Ser/Thr protein kinase RdoA (MazF antagonist)